MVLKKLQKRIGWTFFIFSLIVLGNNVFKICISGNFNELIDPKIIEFFIYPIIFGLSIKFKNKIWQYLQVFIIIFEGIMILIENSNDVFFGLVFIVLSILIAYSYGYFNHFKYFKIIAISLTLGVSFNLFALQENATPIISSIMWLLFIYIFLFLLWIIFKDFVQEYKHNNELNEQKWKHVVEELQKKLDEYTEISHISLNTNKELLQIVKSHMNAKGDNL